MSKRNEDQAHPDKPDATGATERVDVTLSSEDSIAHVIWDVIAHIFDPIFDPIPEIVIEAPDIVETIGAWDIVSGITKEVIVHVGVEIILEVILGRETRQALADLGLGELDPGLEGLEALAANPAARELFAKRMIEARKQGKAFPLPSARELIEYRDRYLKRVIEQGNE